MINKKPKIKIKKKLFRSFRSLNWKPNPKFKIYKKKYAEKRLIREKLSFEKS